MQQKNIKEKDLNYLTNVQSDQNGPTVILPNSISLQTKSKNSFTNQLSHNTRTTVIFSHLCNTLISVDQLCNCDCMVHFKNIP